MVVFPKKDVIFPTLKPIKGVTFGEFGSGFWLKIELLCNFDDFFVSKFLFIGKFWHL